MVLSTPIPLDIIGSIIDETKDDSITLKVTSLVSRSFLSFSQRRLFAKIQLKIGYRNAEDRKRAHLLEAVLTSNSTLASYVRDFSLDIRDLWHPQTMTYPQSIHLSDCILPNIFHALQLLQRFSLSGLWNPQTAIWKSAVLKLCRSPKLHHFCLSGIENFPVSEIPKLHQLRRLSLSDTSLRSDDPDIALHQNGADIPSAKSWLDVLEFDIESTGIHELWTMMTRHEASLRVSRLRALRLAGTNNKMRRDVWEILQDVAGSLECLIWEHTFVPVIDLLIDSNHCGWLFYQRNNSAHRVATTGAPYDMGPLNFGILENLRFLALSFTLNGPITNGNTRITWILNCLKHLGSHKNNLEEFVLALFPNPTTPVTFSLEEWTTSLDHILTGEGFKSLKNLSIRLHMPHSDFLFPPDMVTLMRDRFPLLKSAMKLSVEASHDCGHMSLFENLITKTTRTSRL